MTRMRNTEELEGLLSGPYRWSSATYSSYILVAYTVIIEEMDRLHKIHEKEKQAKKKKLTKADPNVVIDKEEYDLEIAQFVQNVIDESKLVFGEKSWVDVIGTDWAVLKLNQRGVDISKLDDTNDSYVKSKKHSALHLFKLIRDKLSHLKTYTGDMKGKLTYFFDKDTNGVYHLNENKFVMFWITKFPKLMPFLWLKFYKFKEKLTHYYPDDEIKMELFQGSLLDLNIFEEQLQRSLLADMENGNVLKRFRGDHCSLEFRGYHNTVKIKDNFVFMKIDGGSTNNVSLSVSNSTTNKDKLEYLGTAPGTVPLLIIFAEDIDADKVWKYCKSYNCRVVIFCDPEKLTTQNIKEAVAKFKAENKLTFELSESPIKGYELSIDKRNWVYERGQVFIQGREMNIKDIFSDSSGMSDILAGNLLNKLLKNEKPALFENYVYPEYKGVYVERQLSSSHNVSDEKLEHIYVAVNYSLELLSDYGNTQIMVFNNIQHLEDEIDSVKSDCEFILLKEHKEISDEMIEKCDVALCPRIVRFMDGDPYRINPVNSRIAGVCQECELDKKSRSHYSETEFLNIIRLKNIKTFFFRAESGMGKSKLLISLGKRIENSLVVFCSFRKFVDILHKNVTINECTKINVNWVVLKILGCKYECERNVINYWLGRKGGRGAKLELQLDGLDEVPSKHLKLALKTLKIIENDFDSVRLWITSNRQFPSATKEIKFVEWNISPFTKDEKFIFFVESWTVKGSKETDKLGYPSILGFASFSTASDYIRSITKTHNDLTNYPLFCSMIAELHEDNFTQHSTLPTSVNRFDLYESVSKKKFASMIKKKMGMEPDKNDNDFILLQSNYMHVHKYFALVHLFPQASIHFTRPSAMKFLTEENICKMRILTSIEPPAFVHLSYAHFFVALFIVDGIRTGELDNLCSEETFDKFLLYGSPDESNLNMTLLPWQLVNSYLSEKKDWSCFKWLESQDTERHCNVEYSSTFLTYAIKNELWDLARLLINVHKNEMNSVNCNYLLYMAVLCKAPSKWFIEMCEQLSLNNQNKLLICSVQNGQYEIAKYLINTWCGNKKFDEIVEMRKGEGGILHCIVDLFQGPYLTTDRSFIEETKQFIKFVQEKNPKEIKRKNIRGQNLLLALPLLQTSYIETIRLLKKFLVEDLKADVNERSFDGQSILNLGCSCETPSFIHVWYYHRTLAFVASKNFAHINLKSKISGLTPLGEAAQYFGPLLGKPTIELFRDLGANFNELDKDGNSILHYSVKNWNDIEFIKKLVEHGSKTDLKNWEGLCALCFAEKEGKVELRSFFREKMKLRKDETCESNCGNKKEEEKI